MKTALFFPEGLDEQDIQYYENIGLPFGCRCLILGEIDNMPGHIAVVNKDGKVIWGLHPEYFEIDED